MPYSTRELFANASQQVPALQPCRRRLEDDSVRADLGQRIYLNLDEARKSLRVRGL